MQVRAFNGGDFASASRLVGRVHHAHQEARSYWFGADELCGCLAVSDTAFVVERDAAELAAIVCVASGRDKDQNPDMRKHWLQQRTIIATVCRTMGLDVQGEVATGEVADGAALEQLGPQFLEYVTLCVAEGDLPTETAVQLAAAARSWLVDHGVAGEGSGEELPILPSDKEHNEVAFALIEGHAKRAGYSFVNYDYHIERDGKVVAGIVAWALGSELHVDTLAVDEAYRHQGFGGRLLSYVEERAAERGCTTVTVDTFSFQAPEYYPAHGYEVVFKKQLDDGDERIFYTKRL